MSLLTLLASCSPGKRLVTDATTLEQGGLRSEALAKYTSAYYDYQRAEALVGMKRVTQTILDSKLNSAQMLCMTENYDSALAAYEDAFAYKNQNSALELNLQLNAMENFNSCKQSYIESLYAEAEKAVLKEDYDAAQTLIRKIFSLDRKNQKAHYLDTMCEVLPNYNAGKKAMELELWREGYIYLNEVCASDAGYKDAVALRAECLKKGTFAIAYKIKDNKTAPDAVEAALAATINGELLATENPFLELLERENLNVVIQEQQETLSPEFDSDNSYNLGKLKRAQFILSGELVYFKSELTAENSRKCDCASSLGIYSDKVVCFETTQARKLNASYKYQLIDAETGKLYISDVLSFSDEDQSLKYVYEIQKKISLTSPTLTKDHDVNLSGMKNATPDILLTEQDLLLRLYASVANKVSAALEKFSP